jgi:hypothetical protein
MIEAYVIFHPTRAGGGHELYFVSEGDGQLSGGYPLTSKSFARAAKFKTAAEAYAEAGKYEKLQFFRVAKRLCVGRATN